MSWPRCIYHSSRRDTLTVEHVIPKYWFKELYGGSHVHQPAVNDITHLFPAGQRVNSSRGHKGLHFVAVPDASKGVLARALQKMTVKYPEIHDILPFVLVPELYEEWLERPVSAAERRRMVLLEAHEGGWARDD